MLLLANEEKYRDCMVRAVAQNRAWTEEAFNYAMEDDMEEMVIAGSDAIIQVCGPLQYKYDFWAWLMNGCTYQGLAAKITAAVGNPDIKRIVMIYDTPGGEVTGLNECAKMLAACEKPITAIVDPCCASAGLWLASQARRIVSIESGEIGSLGVQAIAFSYAEYFKQEGIDVKVIRAKVSPDKNLGIAYEPLDEKATEYIQSRVDKAGEKFVDAVAKGRGVSRDVVLAKFGQGRMLDADEALAAGLIDEIGTVQSVLAERTTPIAGATTTAGSRKRQCMIDHRERW